MSQKIKVSAHIKKPDSAWQVHAIDNIKTPLTAEVISDYHDFLRDAFPNTKRFILIENIK